MSNLSWVQTLSSSYTDGATITAASATSCIPTYAKTIIRGGSLFVGAAFRITAFGRISCASTTPGSARLDVRFTNPSATTIVVYDSQAVALNAAGKTNVPWKFHAILTCRAIGNATSANFFGLGIFQSEAVVGASAPASGGNGSEIVPSAAGPGVGNGFDSTVDQTMDFFFTQTVTTGSFTVHQFVVESIN